MAGKLGLARLEALVEALDRELNLTDSTLTQISAQSQAVHLIADAADDTTITSLEAGKNYHFGTTTGAFGETDGNNAMTFKLPTPTYAGEKIEITMTNAANINKIIGFTTAVPATQSITYAMTERGGTEDGEVGTTNTGTAGTDNVFVRVSAQTFKLGDKVECVALSTGASARWMMYVVCVNNQMAAGDITKASGNVGGYIS